MAKKSVATVSSPVIKLTVDREKSETIDLSVTATGEVTIEGVEEPLQADGESHEYTLTADEVVIRGAVTDFQCGSLFTGITHLDLSGCPTLTSLDCQGLLGEELDLSKCVNLTELSVSYCKQLTSLDLSKLVNLTKLYLYPSTNFLGKSNAQLTSLDISKCVNLTEFSFDACDKLTSLDLSKFVNLTKLSIGRYEQLTSLGLSKLVNLTELSLKSCGQLTSLDLSKFVNLTELTIQHFKELISLDLSKNINLTKLSLWYCYQLPSLDLSKLVNLTELSLTSCDQLATLDLPKCVNLTALSIKDCGQLTSFDFSKFVNLTELSIRNFDELTSLDLSKHVNLTELSFENCKRLASIDVSGSKNLKHIELRESDSVDLIRCHTEAAPNLNLGNAVQKEEGDVTLIMSKEYAKKKKAGSRKKPKLRQTDAQESTEVRQANPDDCPYELMLYSKRPIRATEFFTFDERDDEVDEIEELIKSGDTMELWEHYYGDGQLFAILDLWGGDEGLYYKVTDEDKNVVSEGDLEIPEDSVCDFGQIKPLITKENHPKYILIRREYRRGATSYYKIPKDLDLEKCTFPSIRAFESFSLINLDWEGDTMTGIEYGFRCKNVEYSSFYSEFDDGDSDFALYEYDEDKGRYNEVASTI